MKSKYLPTVASIRQQGNKVRVTRRRYYRIFDEVTRKVSDVLLSRYEASNSLSETDISYGLLPHGGETLVEITTPSGENLVGKASCSMSDSFVRRIGLIKAIGHSLSSRSDSAVLA